jgi:GTP-binding protein HflX
VTSDKDKRRGKTPRDPGAAEAGERRARRKQTSGRAQASSARTATLVLVPVLQTRGRAGRKDDGAGSPAASRSPNDRLAEATGLAQAIALDVKAASLVPVAQPRPATLLGSGKVEELKGLVAAEEVALVVVDHPLAPVQQKNLEKAWGAKVLDRTGLILEIFGERARTREGRLQVELAHLDYQRSRLVRSWTHLERQRGGFGFLGGPGESQLEADRRMIRERMAQIRSELEAVKRTRELHRGGRRRVPYPVVALVGYTNAGKSTLFNRLTGASVDARERLFETLDPTMREVRLPSGRRIILSDTVGFISELPTMLIAAFRATLEEVIEADLVLHLRDISHEESSAQRADVDAVLRDLGIDPDAAEAKARILEVWNKIDRLSQEARGELANAARRLECRPVLVSAATGEGIEALLARLDERLGGSDEIMEIAVPPGDGALIAWLYRNLEVLERREGEDGMLHMRVRADAARRGRLEKLRR